MINLFVTVQMKALRRRLWDSVFLLFVLSSFVSAGLPIPFSFPPLCTVACGSLLPGCPLSLSQPLAFPPFPTF